MDAATQKHVALIANGLSFAVVILVNCLKNSGSLEDGRFEAGLRDTINHPGAERDRLDYQLLQFLLKRLQEGDQGNDEQEPFLRIIQGGLEKSHPTKNTDGDQPE